MSFQITNHSIIATYGVGSGNAPAHLTLNCVGHLLVAFFKFLKIKCYDNERNFGFNPTGKPVQF